MLCLILLCSLCAIWYFQRWRWLRLTSNIPTLPGTLPIIGVAHQTLGTTESIWKHLEKWSSDASTLGGVFKTWMGPFFIVGVTDADLGMSIMNSYLQRNHFYTFAAPWLGEGLITSNGSTWKRHRKLLAPAFSKSVIAEFLQIFNQQSGFLVKALEEKAGNGKFDSSQVIADIALETICQTAVGLPLGSKRTVSQDYLEAMSKILDIIVTRSKNIFLYPSFIYNRTFAKKEETEAIQILKKMSAKVISTKQHSMQIGSSTEKSKNNINTSHQTKSFLNVLMELNDKGQLSDSEIREETDNVIASGYDTTSTTLQMLLVILGSHPEVQDRLYHEVKSVIPEPHQDITKEELSKLVYLEAVIKETLRLYPTLPVVFRTADRTLKFGDFIIPHGTGICMFFYGINRNKTYWGSEANEFKPERWLHPSTLPDHPAAVASFGLGRRNCIGKSYAMMFLKTSVSHILRQYRVTADHTKLVLKYEMVLKPASGHFISIEQR